LSFFAVVVGTHLVEERPHTYSIMTLQLIRSSGSKNIVDVMRSGKNHKGSAYPGLGLAQRRIGIFESVSFVRAALFAIAKN
jgi:hypothetical protein